MPEAISGGRELTGPEKAAALLLMMSKPPAARLLKQFDQPDLHAVARAAAGLGVISAMTLDRLVAEFAVDFSAGADLIGDAGQVKSLLGDALPPGQIAELLGRRVLGNSAGRCLAGAGASARSRGHCAPHGGKTDDGDLHSVQARFLRRHEGYRRAAAWSTQRRPLRTGRAARCDAARRAAHRRGGGKCVETGAEGGRGRRGTRRASPASSMVSIRRRRRTPCGRLNRRVRKTRRLSKRCSSPSTICRDCPNALGRCLFDRASIDIVVMALRGTDADFRDTVLSSMPSRGPPSGRRRAEFRRQCAPARHRQGAQGHRRNRARHGEPQ